MKLNDLKPATGSRKSRRRVGRGVGSGHGKTAGRGHKGQKSRSGFSQGKGWEGGRSRLIMRLPKRGFNREKTVVQIVNLSDLNRFDAGTTVTAMLLAEHGLVRHGDRPVKLLAEGDLEVTGLVIELDAWSRASLAAVVAAGGTIPAADMVEDAPSAPSPSEESPTAAVVADSVDASGADPSAEASAEAESVADEVPSDRANDEDEEQA